MRSWHLLILVAFIYTALTSEVAAFKFDLHPKEVRCFEETVPSGVEVTISYLTEDGSGQFVDVLLTLESEGAKVDDAKAIIWKEVSGKKGTFKRRIGDGGSLELCFTSRLVPGAKYKDKPIHLDFLVGTDPLAYEEGKVATKHKMRPIQMQLKLLADSTRAIQMEYVNYVDRESEMRSSNEHMTARIMWAALLVIFIVCFSSYAQMRYLERYLRRKRMID